MKNKKLYIVMVTGLIAGQLFAEGVRPFSVVNTLSVGYDDNVERRAGGDGSAFVRDTIDLAFNAAFSDRTDFVFKSQFNLRSDKDTDFYPNLYAVLSHSVSPRVLLQLSDTFRSGTITAGGSDGRHNYYNNGVSLSSTFVASEKDRVELIGRYDMSRYDGDIDELDSTTVGGEVAWAHDIILQRTYSRLSLRHDSQDYDNRNSSTEKTDLALELSHAFNPQWQGKVKGGVTYLQPDSSMLADEGSRIEPLALLELMYSPTPQTQITGTLSQNYGSSLDRRYVAMTERAYRLNVQHDLTAKLMGKVGVAFIDTNYDAKDNETGSASSDEERFDFLTSLSYKLNRINFLILKYKYSDKSYDSGIRDDWDQNMISLGWRVEL